jgi:hypothetical protein
MFGLFVFFKYDDSWFLKDVCGGEEHCQGNDGLSQIFDAGWKSLCSETWTKNYPKCISCYLLSW